MTSLRKLSLAFIASMLVCAELLHPVTAAQKGYKQKCSEDDDCESGYCNLSQKECDCTSYMDKTKRRMESQFYRLDVNRCVSRVGQLCTLSEETKDGLTPFRCIPNAVCATTSNQVQSKELFGMCSCRIGYQTVDDGKECKSNAELRTPEVSSMNQVRPEGWNGSGGKSSTTSSIYESGVLVFVAVITTMFPFR